MIVKRLQLNDFRNYLTADVEFCSGLNVVSGDNAQGKTNLLEAIYLCGVGRSPRTPRDKELIRVGAERARVKCTTKDRGGEQSVEIVIDKRENKRVAIGGLPITRMGELMGAVAAVFFSPDELKIIKDSPGDRRRFMDIALCRMSKAYFYVLARYNKILAQRNRLIKSGKATDDSLDVWDMQLVSEGAKVIKSRRGFVERLNKIANKNHLYLTNDKERLNLSYEGLQGETLDEIANSFSSALTSSRERDLLVGYTSVGPQKDDIAVSIGEVDLRAYGSQGQQRTAALSLKLSEVELHKNESGEDPVLLLDDVLSELDPSRQNRLLKRIESYQTIVTCTHLDSALDFRGVSAHFTVKEGKVTRS